MWGARFDIILDRDDAMMYVVTRWGGHCTNKLKEIGILLRESWTVILRCEWKQHVALLLAITVAVLSWNWYGEFTYSQDEYAEMIWYAVVINFVLNLDFGKNNHLLLFVMYS